MNEPSRADTVVQQGDLGRFLFQSLTDHAICVLDAEGRVTRWNPGAEQLFGYSEQEALGQHLSTYYPPDGSGGQAEDELQKAREEGYARAERWQVRKDGTRFWALCSTRPHGGLQRRGS